MESKNYIEVFPNKINLKKQFGQTYFESKVVITNKVDKYVLFKVYINKSTQYSANPSTGFLKPGESNVINIKRVEKDVVTDESKAKFLILAFPSNKVILDLDEAKAVIKASDLKSETNQEIYLEAEYEAEDAQLDGRKTMYTKAPNRNLNIEEAEKENPFAKSTLGESTLNYSSVEPNVKIMSIAQEIDETMKQIDELKKSIQNYESENTKMNTILTNYAILSKEENAQISDKFPFSFVVLLLVIGLTLGAYFNRLIS